MACLTIRNFPRMRSHRTRTTHSLVPSADYFTTTLKTYAYNKKSIQTLTSVARLALNGESFFALCTSSISKILRAGTFCPYPSVCPPGYYFSLLSMCFKNNILSASHIFICNLSAYVYVSMNLRIATAPLGPLSALPVE